MQQCPPPPSNIPLTYNQILNENKAEKGNWLFVWFDTKKKEKANIIAAILGTGSLIYAFFDAIDFNLSHATIGFMTEARHREVYNPFSANSVEDLRIHHMSSTKAAYVIEYAGDQGYINKVMQMDELDKLKLKHQDKVLRDISPDNVHGPLGRSSFAFLTDEEILKVKQDQFKADLKKIEETKKGLFTLAIESIKENPKKAALIEIGGLE